MRILIYTNGLGIGGTEKAATMWATGLKSLGHDVHYAVIKNGPRVNELEKSGIKVYILPKKVLEIKLFIEDLNPDIIHYHSPGNENPDGKYFVSGIQKMENRPIIIQTNVFGLLENNFEESVINFTLFVSWTSCVQSAIRKGFKIKKKYFLNKSVVVNPLELNISNLNDIRNKSRKKLNIAYDEVVFGKIARPDFVKWNLLPIDAFNIAVKHNKKLKLLLQEPPTEVIAYIEKLKINDNVIVLPTTTSFDELLSSYAAIDVILHITDFGESFGYGIAEPMALSKPIITNSIPWGDQAQVELVKHGINGFIANSAYTISKTILWFAENKKMIPIMGAKSKLFIDSYSSYSKSIERLESIMKSLLKNRMNPFFVTDFHDAKIAEINLQRYNYGVFFIDKFVTFFKNLYINLKMIFFKLYNSINR